MSERRWIDRDDGGVELWTHDGPPHAPWRCAILTAEDVNALRQPERERVAHTTASEAVDILEALALMASDGTPTEKNVPLYADKVRALLRQPELQPENADEARARGIAAHCDECWSHHDPSHCPERDE